MILSLFRKLSHMAEVIAGPAISFRGAGTVATDKPPLLALFFRSIRMFQWSLKPHLLFAP